MKVLTVRQPYAQAIVEGDKTVEVRSRPTRHRGPLAIHAAARPEPCLREFCGGMPLGTVIGTVTVIDCRPLTGADLAAALLPDDFPTDGMWAWCLSEPLRVRPLPRRGQLGLWHVDDDELTYL